MVNNRVLSLEETNRALKNKAVKSKAKRIICLAVVYFFLILLIKPFKNPKSFVGLVVIITVIFTVLMRVSGTALSFLTPFFDALDNEHINKYTEGTVHSGFYVAVLIHSAVVYVAYTIRKCKLMDGSCSTDTDTLYYTVLLSLVFCPFYAVSLTFMRLITAFSLVVVTAGSGLLANSNKSRVLCVKLTLFVVFTFYLMRIAFGGFFYSSVIPYFDVL